MTIEEQLIEKLRGLPLDKQREVLAFADSLQKPERKQSRRSLLGLWADLNIDISEKDIDDMRHEMWSNFPREL